MALTDIWQELSQYSIPEIIAVLASLSYVILAARENRACWPAAMMGSGIYVVVFFQYQLYMDSALNVFYVAMAVYGWLTWKTAREQSTTVSQISVIKIHCWSKQTHLCGLLAVTLLTLISGSYLANNTDAAFPYLDSLTTWSSLFATWMVVNKVLENWLYWIAIDVLSLYLYINKGLFFTSALFVLYIIIAGYGYWYWRQRWQAQRQEH
ncbi:MAG: nicotinamide mononucleotide transporter [Cellvibrionales bacterium]|nr:nicotinamide mononucleotide transporter [Cellvibrionales bacterium]